MILGIGVDVVNTGRVERALSRFGARFEDRIFTPSERAACDQRADRVQALAARLAAKEAFLKALGTGWIRGLSLRQVEIRKAHGGRPELELSGGAAEQAQRRGVTSMHVTLSHEPGFAAAVVILEG